MARQPIAELFGYPPDNESAEAKRCRDNRLCPYNNKVPNCTKDSVTDPLGVCTIFHGQKLALICPVRLREDWLIAEHAAKFFFPQGSRWTTLVEVKLKDVHGKSAGNIDVVLVAYDENGVVTDFGSLEIQTVYISGTLRSTFFKPATDDRLGYLAIDWSKSRKRPPHPDYLSSSRKRLAPQLIYKGGILKKWGRKQAVAVHSAFFETLPELPEVPSEEADIAWLVYDIVFDPANNVYNLELTRSVFTKFQEALDRITITDAGEIGDFLSVLQTKLNDKLGLVAVGETEDLPGGVDGNESGDLFDQLENL